VVVRARSDSKDTPIAFSSAVRSAKWTRYPAIAVRWATLRRLRDNTQCTERSHLTNIVQILLKTATAIEGMLLLSNRRSTVTYDDRATRLMAVTETLT
jgi:hypothetical protein